MTLIAIIAQSLWFIGVLGFWGFGVTISVMAMMDSVGSIESAGIKSLAQEYSKLAQELFHLAQESKV